MTVGPRTNPGGHCALAIGDRVIVLGSSFLPSFSGVTGEAVIVQFAGTTYEWVKVRFSPFRRQRWYRSVQVRKVCAR